ncbi:MAG: hypothetical protein K6U75_16735 [Firmicutes bacterium]|nr:hypothetical protein [Bacillota bacterium]
MSAQGKPKLVWRKRRKPDGSYEWILDTPDWYERELRWKEWDEKVLTPLLNGVFTVNRIFTRALYKGMGTFFRAMEERLLGPPPPPPPQPKSRLLRALRAFGDALDRALERAVCGPPLVAILKVFVVWPLVLLLMPALIRFLRWVIDWYATYVFR